MDLAKVVASSTKGSHIDIRGMGQELDSLTHQARLDAVTNLPRQLYAQLFDIATEYEQLRLEDFVPLGFPPNAGVEHIGINNKRMFRHFSKIMFRTLDGKVAGYSRQPWMWFSGPGYFVIDPIDSASEAAVVFDYDQQPDTAPQGWPKIVSNRRSGAYFVYRSLKNYVRRVSQHITVGRAVRAGKVQRQCFILVRNDVTARSLAHSESTSQVA